MAQLKVMETIDSTGTTIFYCEVGGEFYYTQKTSRAIFLTKDTIERLVDIFDISDTCIHVAEIRMNTLESFNKQLETFLKGN